MVLDDGYVVDLIQWESPYDASAPYTDQAHLGLTTLSLLTNNLVSDMAALAANGVEYTGPIAIEQPVAGSKKITFADPDGIFIELVQPGDVESGETPNASGVTYITGALQTNVNVSDYSRAVAFYTSLGFELNEEFGSKTAEFQAASMTLPGGHQLMLTQLDKSGDESLYADLNHIGIARIAIETANIEEDVRILEEQGIEFYSSPITPAGPLGILRYVCFEDPDGTVIELVQYN
jgi:catechol 2,3-dioxygenase-like lactoylglutathione lyase family enzyme